MCKHITLRRKYMSLFLLSFSMGGFSKYNVREKNIKTDDSTTKTFPI